MSKPVVEALGDTYRFSWVDEQIVIELSRIHEDKQDLRGDILILSQRLPNPGLLHDARLNLSSSTAQKQLANALKDREAGVEWGGIITQLVYLTKERWREGEPLVDLSTVDYKERPRWLLEPFLTYGGPTVIFADGGSGKSIFALALARSVACGRPIVTRQAPAEQAPVLYLDWETDAATHSERMAAICAGQGCETCENACPIYYRRQAASLHESAAGLRRKIAEMGVGLVVVDSLGAARGGDPNSAEITILTFNALRSFGVPILIVDHVTKAAGADSTKPYGSVYSYNLARMTWGMTKAQELGERRSTIALSNHKSNNGRLLPRLGYEVHFVSSDNDDLIMVGFKPCDIRDDPVLSRTLPLKDQIVGVLRANQGEALTPGDISRALESDGIAEVGAETVRAILGRYRGRLFVSLERGRWGLLAHV